MHKPVTYLHWMVHLKFVANIAPATSMVRLFASLLSIVRYSHIPVPKPGNLVRTDSGVTRLTGSDPDGPDGGIR